MKVNDYRKKKIKLEYDIEKFQMCWNKLMQAVDFLQVVTLAGGEVCLYPYFSELVSIIAKTDKVQIINVLTTGTVLMDEEKWNVLKNEKVVVSIDNYGSKLKTAQKETITRFKEKLEEMEINYIENDNSNGTWYDLGNFENKHRSIEENERTFYSCLWNKELGLMPDLKIGICYMQLHARMFGFNELDVDSIDLETESVQDIRRKIKELTQKRSLKVCSFCNGSNEKNLIEAGRQPC